MANAEHTPGPWRLFTGDARRVTDQYGNRICTTAKDHSIGLDVSKGATKEGNARLIAAAPDMLLALESILERLNRIDTRGNYYLQEEVGRAQMAANAAIAKARGQQ